MLVSCAVVIICALLYHFTRPPDPVYEGRRLSEWLEDLDPLTVGSGNVQFIWLGAENNQKHDQAVVAIQKLGIKSLPYLESKLLQDENFWYKNTPPFFGKIFNLTRKREIDFEPVLFACYVLGPEAHSLAPALLRYEINYAGSMYVESVWQRIGPKAGPFLMEQIQGKNREASEFASYALAELRPVTEETVIFFIGEISKTNNVHRENALRCFSATTNQYAQIFPLTTNCLGHSDYYTRMLALMVLSDYSSHAATVLPLITNAFNDTSFDVRRAATNALHAITSAPSAASTPATPP